MAVATATTVVLLSTGASAHATPPTVTAGCTINVVAGTHTCSSVAGISVQALTGGRLLLKLSFAPNQTATFAVTYSSAPSGYTANIGDSISNDGGGGDAGTQSNDAELMIFNQQYSVFGRDGTPFIPLLSVANAGISAGETILFEIADRRVCWNFGTHTCTSSEWLYALMSQPDSEGPVNNDIYAAFNRVVSGRPDRVGTGVSTVSVFLN